MIEKAPPGLMDWLGQVPDPRLLRTQRHKLLDILAVVPCAVIGGPDKR